jgi:predicted phage tail protein
MAMTIDSAAFGTSLPSRAYKIAGITVLVPANYDPVART